MSTHPGTSIPSLDGIRALSILIVLFAHAGYGHIVPGGLGVTIFFFLSGYLITTLLLREHARSGTLHIGHFFARRFLRLMPALIVTLACAHALAWSGWLPGGTSGIGLLAQLLYLANYYQLYFMHLGPVPEGTEILWSLAVEEHFYILYPLLLTLLLRRASGRGVLWTFALACAAVLAWRTVLVVGLHADPYRTYYATDTRIDSILFGCMLAVAKPGIDASFAARPASRWPAWLAVGGLLLMLVSLLVRGPVFRETLRYSLQGLALLPLFYFAITQRHSWAFRLLNTRALARLGVYSYSVYLSHFVILKLLQAHGLAGAPNMVLLLAVAPLSVLYAIGIDRLVEPRFDGLKRRFRRVQ